MTVILHSRATRALVLASALLVAACSKENATTDGKSPGGEHESEKGHSGKVIVVEAYSDGNGNYFKPNQIRAEEGDILRFTLKSGVHNVHFLPDSNPGKANLPPASEMLQLPDQTYDVPVTFEKGTYYFQCDPHAALGMKGHVVVDD